MTSVDVAQLQDGPDGPEGLCGQHRPSGHQSGATEDARSSRERTRNFHVTRSLDSDAMAVHSDGCKESVRSVNVAIFALSGNSWHIDEIHPNSHGNEV